MVDRRLIKQCLKGDRDAQYKLYSHCYALLMPVGIRYYTHQEDASSAVNQVVVTVLEKNRLWKDGIPFDQWVKRIYINMAVDQYRKERRGQEIQQEYHSSQPTTYNDINEQWNLDAIQYLIEQLPRLQKTIFQLNLIEGYNHGEISEILGISENNSRYLLHRARKSLQTAITNHEVKLRK